METEQQFFDNDIEQALIGYLIFDSSQLFDISEIFNPIIFFNPENREIAQAIFELKNANLPIDTLTIYQHLKKTGSKNPMGATKFTAAAMAKSGGVEYLCKILVELYIKRELKNTLFQTLINLNEKSDPFESINQAEKALAEITQSIVPSQSKMSANVYQESIERIEKMQSKSSKLIGLDAAFEKLNEVNGGWQAPDLVILAARPGMGKTSMMLKFISKLAFKEKKTIGIFSVEMSNMQLMNRILSLESGIELRKILTGEMHKEQFEQIKELKYIANSKIYFDDANGSLTSIKNKARVWVIKNKVEMIFIDYLQLINNPTKGNREQQVSEISRTLKGMAKELNVPIMALAQLSRDSGGQQPQLSHLRESGAIEQDADMVLFIHRPNYYKKEHNGIETDVELIIAKHRNGATGIFNINFNPALTKFYDEFDYQNNQLPSTFQHQSNDF